MTAASTTMPDPIPKPRLGPRPLPTHLLTAAGLWRSSRLALPLLKNGSLSWRPDLAERARRLAADLGEIPLPEIASALDAALARRAERLITGLENYRRHPYRRSVVEPPPVWQSGTTRLLDFNPAGGTPLLVIPSLINRAYILDLAAECSMLRSLAAEGLRPLLIDWGSPGEAERGFDLTDYLKRRLDPALTATIALAGQPPLVMGYCMGGLMALALAVRREQPLSGLILLATPWDFDAMSGYAPVLGALAEPLLRFCQPQGEIPAEIIHQLLAVADPLQAIRKFSAFAARDPSSAAARRFVATEDWLNDGVPLALGVAGECLGGWYGANTPARGAWTIEGDAVRPEDLTLPTLIVQPSRDRLVPPASVEAFATSVRHADWLKPDLGHIGIATSTRAPAEVWQPIARWVDRLR